MPNTVQHEIIRRFRYLLESIQPPPNIHFSFGISFTSWSYIVLLLILLVLTLPHQCTDLYNQVKCNMQLWTIM